MRALVVTTVHAPNRALQSLAAGAQSHGFRFIIVGDTKTPSDFKLFSGDYMSVAEQEKRFSKFCRVLPKRHYARKNVGYLAAMIEGVSEILETDDDNLPEQTFWQTPSDMLEVDAVSALTSCAWFNVYSLFSGNEIWPRGFPLEFVRAVGSQDRQLGRTQSRALIIQRLADGNPDVDAVYRLTRPLPVYFRTRNPVLLQPGVWCPFNSQNTLFRREAFPLLYLPSQCSFRMTDIWRSFVAQRCLWERGEGIVFQSATVIQERNEHDLLVDFSDEVSGYLSNDRIRAALEDCALDKRDLLRSHTLCYERLIKDNFLPAAELPILAAWRAEVERAID